MKEVWIGSATYDHGIELSKSNYLPTHHISMAVDIERNKTVLDLTPAYKSIDSSILQFAHPTFLGVNAAGDRYITDGNIVVISFNKEPNYVNPTSQKLGEQLKNRVFMFFNQIISELGF